MYSNDNPRLAHPARSEHCIGQTVTVEGQKHVTNDFTQLMAQNVFGKFFTFYTDLDRIQIKKRVSSSGRLVARRRFCFTEHILTFFRSVCRRWLGGAFLCVIKGADLETKFH